MFVDESDKMEVNEEAEIKEEKKSSAHKSSARKTPAKKSPVKIASARKITPAKVSAKNIPSETVLKTPHKSLHKTQGKSARKTPGKSAAKSPQKERSSTKKSALKSTPVAEHDTGKKSRTRKAPDSAAKSKGSAKKTVNIEESKNEEYEEIARNLSQEVEDVIDYQRANSSQKANSMANATLGTSSLHLILCRQL